MIRNHEYSLDGVRHHFQIGEIVKCICENTDISNPEFENERGLQQFVMISDIEWLKPSLKDKEDLFYQFVIYDHDKEDCYNEDGVIEYISSLYSKKSRCEEAKKYSKKLNKSFNSKAQFEYLINEVNVDRN